MKFLTVRDLRANSAAVWRDLATEHEMVVTSNGRPVAVLTAVNEGNVEESLRAWRRVRAQQAVAAIQQASVQNGTDHLTMAQIDAEIRQTRRARRTKHA